jgi:hypothetical protein
MGLRITTLGENTARMGDFLSSFGYPLTRFTISVRIYYERMLII